MAPPKPSCKDCGSTTRKLNRPGPRCATCWRTETARRRETAWERHLWRTYRITAEQYWAIYEVQGGACAICQRAKGIRRRLAVDHDHRCCPETPTCGRCTRGLACTTCNKRVLGHLRDDPEAFIRGANYLQDPPARRVLQWSERSE